MQLILSRCCCCTPKPTGKSCDEQELGEQQRGHHLWSGPMDGIYGSPCSPWHRCKYVSPTPGTAVSNNEIGPSWFIVILQAGRTPLSYHEKRKHASDGNAGNLPPASLLFLRRWCVVRRPYICGMYMYTAQNNILLYYCCSTPSLGHVPGRLLNDHSVHSRRSTVLY